MNYEPEFEERASDEEFVDDDYDEEEEMDVPAALPVQKLPEQVIDFIKCLHKAILDRNVFEIQNLYENTFNRLTEKFFKNATWPEEEQVKQIIKFRKDSEDETFIILYKDLYYRHLYARFQNISLNQRVNSFLNYCGLFNFILHTDAPVELELPNQWLWDIIDEFIYQFQNYTFFKASPKIQNLTPEEQEDMLKPSIWNVHAILNVLYSLVEKSQINQQLKQFNNGGNPEEVAGEFGKHIFYKMLGYFSLIGLLRLHCIMGDYHQAIKVLSNIDLNRQQLQSMAISRVLACQVTTFYYVGFAYLMMRRYSEAIQTFSNILVYLQRTKPIYHYRTFQIDMIEKMTDQIYKFMAISLALHPQRIDESVQSTLNEKLRDSFIKLQAGNEAEFEQIFKAACPKIISILPGTKTYQHQIAIFMEEVKQQHKLLEMRSFLKFYTTMPIVKLAEFLEIKPEEFNRYLLCFKHKMQNFGGKKTEDLSGSDVDFYVDKDMIHIADTKVAPRYGDYFLRQIYRFEELSRLISNINV